MIIYLYAAKADAKAHLPSFNTSNTDVIVLSSDVKGATTLASASLKAMPTCAAFNAPQSLPPSPQNKVVSPCSTKLETIETFSLGVHRPNTLVCGAKIRAVVGSEIRRCCQTSPVRAKEEDTPNSETLGSAAGVSSVAFTHSMTPSWTLLPITTFSSCPIRPAFFAM